MKTNKTIAVAALGLITAALLLVPGEAFARYPKISPIGDLVINMNERGPVIRFLVSDRDTSANELVVTYRSDNPDLVPEEDENIRLGGSGQDRTIVIIPAKDQYGSATITLIVTDTDGDSNREPFLVVVNRPI
ncbi:MAG TPA: hypothetical protein PLZ86_10190 [bacterium]|nr:hypothetical protein [bacterium]